jgi:hypothetical protein
MADSHSNEQEGNDGTVSYAYVAPSQPRVPAPTTIRKPRIMPMTMLNHDALTPQSVQSSREPESMLDAAASTATAVMGPIKPSRPALSEPAIDIVAAPASEAATSSTGNTRLRERIHVLEAQIEQMAVLVNPPAYESDGPGSASDQMTV